MNQPARAPRLTAPAERREVARILALPRRAPIDCDRDLKTKLYTPEAEALADLETARYALRPGEPPTHDPNRPPGTCRCAEIDGGHPCITRLYPSQAWFLRELRLYRGAVGFLTTAAGKTLLNLLAPLAAPGCRSAVLLAKPDQRLHYRTAYERLREHFRVPKVVWDDGGGAWWDDGGATPVLRFVPYTKLSNPKTSEILEELDPDSLFTDESHKISNREARATARALRFLAERRGRVTFSIASASLIRKMLGDVAYLSLFSLGSGSPYPMHKDEIEAWGLVVDPCPDPDDESDLYDALVRAFAEGGRQVADAHPLDAIFGSGLVGKIRQGILERALWTPGVVSTRVSESTASIVLCEFKVPSMPEVVRKHLVQVRDDWVRPDGEEFEEAFEVVECAKNVAVGFFNFWHFFRNPPRDLIDEWKEARKEWHREVRGKIREDVPQLDSPALLEEAAKRAWADPPYEGKKLIWKARTWPRWAAVKDKVTYEKRSKWIDDWFAQALAAWGRKQVGIIWYQSDALGERVSQILGVPKYNGGPRAEAAIRAEKGDRSLVMSLSAHGQGLDGLQYRFHRGLAAEPQSSGDGWHQFLGRYVRPGQKEDTVEISVPLHVREFREAMRSAYRFAEFDQQVSPNRQLLLAADVDFDLKREW